MAEQWDFTRPFQVAVLKLVINDKRFLPSYSQIFEPEYFDQVDLRHVARHIITFWEKYGQTPGVDELRNLVDQQYEPLLDEIDQPTEFTADFIKDSIIRFARNQAMKDAIMKSVDCLKEQNPDPIFDIVKKALQVGIDAKAIGSPLHEGREAYITRATQDLRVVREPVPTGITALDEMLGGGLGKGELGIIMAAPNVGKTVAVINIGVAALRAGKHVFHYSFEMGEARVLNRYDRCITGMTNLAMRSTPKRFARMMQDFYNQTNQAELIVKKLPYKGASVNDLRAHIEMVANEVGITPGLIISDYGDIMKSIRKYTERRHESADIYGELRNLGEEYDCPVWSPSQANREGAKQETIELVHAAESWEKMALADVVLTLSQSKQEQKADRLRVLLDKNRDGKKNETFNLRTNYDRMRIEPIDKDDAGDDPDQGDDDSDDGK